MYLQYEFYIAANPSVVWDAFMSPEGVREIFYGSEFRSNCQVGDSFEYVGPGEDGKDTVHLYGKVLAYEAVKDDVYEQLKTGHMSQ